MPTLSYNPIASLSECIECVCVFTIVEPVPSVVLATDDGIFTAITNNDQLERLTDDSKGSAGECTELHVVYVVREIVQ